MKHFSLAVACMLLVPSSMALAQQEGGDAEISVSGFYYTTVGSGLGTGFATFNGKMALFLTDHFQIGAFPSLSIVIGDNATTIFGSGFFATVSLLADAMTVPYFGGQYYIQSFNDVSNTRYAGINGGAKFFLSERAFFDLSGNYLFGLGQLSQGNLLVISAGFGFLF